MDLFGKRVIILGTDNPKLNKRTGVVISHPQHGMVNFELFTAYVIRLDDLKGEKLKRPVQVHLFDEYLFELKNFD